MDGTKSAAAAINEATKLMGQAIEAIMGGDYTNVTHEEYGIIEEGLDGLCAAKSELMRALWSVAVRR